MAFIEKIRRLKQDGKGAPFIALLTAGGAIGCGSDPVDLTRTNAIGEVRQALVAGAEARAEEVAAHLAEHYFSGLTVLATTQGPYGEIVDWTEAADNIPPSLDETEVRGLPDHDDDTLEAHLDLQSDYDFRDLWDVAYQQAPSGTVPVIRPNYADYVNGNTDEESIVADSIDDYIAQIPTPQPSNVDRLYAGKIDSRSNVGTNGWIQYLRFADVPANGMSLAQLAVTCDGSNFLSTLEAIEVGVQVLPGLYGDSLLHLFTYFRTAGVASGDLVGGYNRIQIGFTPCTSDCNEQHTSTTFPPGSALGPAPWRRKKSHEVGLERMSLSMNAEVG